MEITQTPTGWHIVSQGMHTEPFTADLPICRYDHNAPGTGRHKAKPKAKGTGSCDVPDGGWHPENVAAFAEAVAKTYGRERPAVPVVPFDPELLDPKVLDRLSKIGAVPAAVAA